VDRLERPEGLEPPTRCLEGSCSIHLSYGRARKSVYSGLSRSSPRYARAVLRSHAARKPANKTNTNPAGYRPTPVTGVGGTLASSSAGLFFSELTGAGVCREAWTLVDGLTVGVSIGEAITADFGAAVEVVLLFFTTIATTPAPSMKTIKVASSARKPFSVVSPL
jgi:hypothetical protein